MKVILFSVFIFISFNSFSKDREDQKAIMKIYMLDKDKKIAVLRYPLGLVLKRTSHFEMTPGYGESCQASLIKNTKSFGLFDMSNCMQMYDLQKNQKMRVVSKRYIELENTVLKNLEKREEINRIFEQEELWLNMVKKEESLKEKRSFGAEFKPSSFSSKKIIRPKKKYNLESWYMSISASKASTSYAGELQSDLDDLEKEYGSSQTSFSIDGGLYQPIKDGRSLLGASVYYLLDIRTGGDESSSSNVVVNSVQTISSQILLGASYIKFLGHKRTGQGLFFRGDLGVSLYEGASNQDLEVSGLDTSVTTTYNFSPGLGYLLGGGYAFEWGDGKSLLIELNYLKTAATLSSKTRLTTISGVEAESEEDVNDAVTATNILFKVGLLF